MSKVKEKQQALIMRRNGESIKEIAKALGVSKGSVSLWCQEIELTIQQKRRLKEKQIQAGAYGREIGAKSNKKKRLNAIEAYKFNGLKNIGTLSDRDLLLLGIGLYWGEGIKSRSGMAAIVNSDPDIIKLSHRWFRKCFQVHDSEFRPYVYVSAHHHDRANDIVKFWSTELRIKVEYFKIILLKNRPKKRYENHDNYYGVIHLRVRKSTDLKYRILGLIDACRAVD